MADISKIQIPGNDTYDIADSTARESAASKVSNVAWDDTDKKLTQTIGETTTDIVTGETILDPLIPVKTTEGALVSFPDGADLPMPSFICNIDAVQDLHGYDGPWGGGAGKNKLPMTVDGIKELNTGGTWSGNAYTRNGVTFTLLTDNDGNVTGIKANGTSMSDNEFNLTTYRTNNYKGYIINGSTGGSSATYNLLITYSNNGTSWANEGYATNGDATIRSDYDYVRFGVLIRNGVTITNKIFYPMIRLATETDPSFAPYSNICPISGHTGVDAWVRGKNIFCTDVTAVDKTTEYRTNPAQRTKLTKISDNSFRATGNGGSWSTGYYEIDGIDGTLDYAISYTIKDNNTRYTPTITKNELSDESKLILHIAFSNNSRLTSSEGATFDNVQIELSETATAYEPYNPNSQTIQVSWQTEAGEVYGGYIDLVSGVLTVTDGYIDLGTCEWLRTDLGNGNYRYYNTEISDVVKKPSSTSIMPNIECSHYKNKLPSQYNQAVDGITIYTNGSIQVYDSTKSALTTTDFKTAMDGVQLVYELATPITYQLTPTQIKSLLGNNNAWCDTGDVDVKYTTQPYDGISAKYSEYAFNAVNKTGDTMEGRLEIKEPINQIITGTGTEGEDKGSGVSPRYFPAQWKFDTGVVKDGDIYTIKIPVAGIASGVWMSVDNGTTYYPVVTSGTSRLQTQYGVDTYITVIFEATGSASIYPKEGGDSAETVTGGVFRVINYYDTNTDTKVRQTLTSGNTNRPLLMGYSATSTTTTNVDNVSYRNNSIYANPSTGAITATKFVGSIADATGLTSTQVTTALGFTPTDNVGTITGIKMNGSSKGTSGVVDLGTVITDVSGKADKSATVSTVAYDTTNKKITKTINGTKTDVVTVSTLKSDMSLGTAADKAYTTSVTDGSSDLVTSGAVYTAIDNLPEPMVFKGSLGTGGTITALPVNGTATVGDTYKVITAGTYAGTAAKVGDTFICDSKTSSANTWTLIPSGDEPSGTVTSVTIKGTSPIVSSNSSAITTSGTRTISHATSGVTAGTYQSVTVDTYGHVTAGSNPTTISGYGITDAKIDNDIITLGSNTLTTVPVQNNAGYHNSIYRGKFLGTSITAEQWASIRAGTFEDMYIGDYWTLSTTLGDTTSNVKYVIAAFDYWWNCGDSYPQTQNYHHIVLVPATNLYSAKMNESNITTGGYVGSKMYTDYLANARTGISTLFGDHLYSVRRLFVNTVNAAGQGTAWDRYTSSVDLMNETMVYGHPIWTTSGFEVGVDRTILPLFALNPASASIRSGWWLRCAATSAAFAGVDYNGVAACYSASLSFGVRPAFAIY